MQGNNALPGGNGSNKGGGLSWSSPAAANTNTNQNSGQTTLPIGGNAKPANQQAAKPVANNANANIKSQEKKIASNPTTPSTGRMVGLFASGVVVGGLLVWGWTASNPSPTANTASVAETETSNTTGAQIGTNTGSSGTTITAGSGLNLSFPSTQKAGTSVVITSANVSAPTWIIVYDNNNGKPGNALGAHMALPAQNGKAATITLLRATVAGKSYLVGERVDNGDKNYSTSLDKEVTGINGAPAYMTLNVQ